MLLHVPWRSALGCPLSLRADFLLTCIWWALLILMYLIVCRHSMPYLVWDRPSQYNMHRLSYCLRRQVRRSYDTAGSSLDSLPFLSFKCTLSFWWWLSTALTEKFVEPVSWISRCYDLRAFPWVMLHPLCMKLRWWPGDGPLVVRLINWLGSSSQKKKKVYFRALETKVTSDDTARVNAAFSLLLQSLTVLFPNQLSHPWDVVKRHLAFSFSVPKQYCKWDSTCRDQTPVPRFTLVGDASDIRYVVSSTNCHLNPCLLHWLLDANESTIGVD